MRDLVRPWKPFGFPSVTIEFIDVGRFSPKDRRCFPLMGLRVWRTRNKGSISQNTFQPPRISRTTIRQVSKWRKKKIFCHRLSDWNVFFSSTSSRTWKFRKGPADRSRFRGRQPKNRWEPHEPDVTYVCSNIEPESRTTQGSVDDSRSSHALH